LSEAATPAPTAWTFFIDYDREKLKKASYKTRVWWLEQRLKMVLIRPLERLLHCSAVNTKPDASEKVSFILAGFTLILCGIEALGSFHAGHSKQGFCFKNFEGWMKRYMPDWAQEGILEWLWHEARCGLAHQLNIKSGGLEHKLDHKYVRKDGTYQVKPDPFFEDFVAGAKDYFQELRKDGADSLLGKSFLKWMDKGYLLVG